ncbi:hypothetical protein EVAR_21934_1 [Eumeta japonica]|uniref:Uncharacterized protein n=1 Tax=Eumeta variegata TaxID=151549 RepID=A0A4C1XHV6_EUMVA|nr:hypothetical protein EVAR_21934_1 [Eumeta japonica]
MYESDSEQVGAERGPADARFDGCTAADVKRRQGGRGRGRRPAAPAAARITSRSTATVPAPTPPAALISAIVVRRMLLHFLPVSTYPLFILLKFPFMYIPLHV